MPRPRKRCCATRICRPIGLCWWARPQQRGGIEQKNETYLRRSIELLERSVLLLPQKMGFEIDEAVIQKEIAQCYLSLGQPKQAIEILKEKHNVGGLYHSLIGFADAATGFHLQSRTVSNGGVR